MGGPVAGFGPAGHRLAAAPFQAPSLASPPPRELVHCPRETQVSWLEHQLWVRTLGRQERAPRGEPHGPHAVPSEKCQE